MTLFSPRDRHLAHLVSRLAHGNPFLAERRDNEHAILGDQADQSDSVWHARLDVERNPNVPRIAAVTAELCQRARCRLDKGERPVEDEIELYQDAVVYLLYNRFFDRLTGLLLDARRGGRVPFFSDFSREWNYWLAGLPGIHALHLQPEHLLAGFFQVRRAFFHVFGEIVGGSAAAARLRASVWESVFTRDMRRYRRALVDRLTDVTTLITGPSGTGKELVARAVGLSQNIPFDPTKQAFVANAESSFIALNLSAFSPTLVESELFGHCRGSFTGAVQDRVGWLELCPGHGAVFLDEVGDTSPALQVKLLRVLQERTFQRLGESKERRFFGKLIAATNRDWAEEMRAGRLRQDFFYRLCADMIETPDLKSLIGGSEEELAHLVGHICVRLVGREEASALADEVLTCVRTSLGMDYAWPGNFRELEQCVRNVMIRGHYIPLVERGEGGDDHAVFQKLSQMGLSADEVVRRYCRAVYTMCGSYLETGRRLGLDRRTVKQKTSGL